VLINPFKFDQTYLLSNNKYIDIFYKNKTGKSYEESMTFKENEFCLK